MGGHPPPTRENFRTRTGSHGPAVSARLCNPRMADSEPRPLGHRQVSRRLAWRRSRGRISAASCSNRHHQDVAVETRLSYYPGLRYLKKGWQSLRLISSVHCGTSEQSWPEWRAFNPVGFITTPARLLHCRSRGESRDSNDGRHPRAYRSAPLFVRRGRAAPSPCSSASAASCSCVWQ